MFSKLLFWIFLANYLSLSLAGAKQENYFLTDYCQLNSQDPAVLVLSKNGQYSAGTLKLAQVLTGQPFYKAGMNCSLILCAPVGYQLLLTFSFVNIRSCEFDELLVITGQSNQTNYSDPICGQHKCHDEDCPELDFVSTLKLPNITVKFQSSTEGNITFNYTGFEATFTVFDSVDNVTHSCEGSERFRCNNGRCIWQNFYCNGHNNCGDRSDEPFYCPHPVTTTQTIWGVVVIVFGITMICFFVPLFIFLAICGSRSSITTTTSFFEPNEHWPGINDSGICSSLSDPDTAKSSKSDQSGSLPSPTDASSTTVSNEKDSGVPAMAAFSKGKNVPYKTHDKVKLIPENTLD
ncbi:abnormal cell migration protein 13-like isoform X2 [Limulus polyphemus]|nr:abnormal cell migration protein 13-like isoform X2 [Limulus polyphemus]XP_022246339.1 abnormal cell migration protein 13-like isoform X2 [Limulus polyphemus]